MLSARGYFRTALTDSDCDHLRELGKRAERIIREVTQITAIEEQALLYELCLLALKELSTRSICVDEKAKKKVDLALLKYFRALPETLTLRDLCRDLHISPAQLRRDFHRILGVSPRSAFSNIRIKKAEELLASTDLTVEHISQQVGFATTSALINAMKRTRGCSPTQLRKLRKAGPSTAEKVQAGTF